MGKNRLTLILLMLAGIAAALSLMASGYALVDRFSKTDARRNEQTQFNEKLAALANSNCHDIEQLKAAQREQANQDFRELHRNLRILGIKETREIRRVARRQHSHVLVRFAPQACPRKPAPHRPNRR